MTEVSNTGNIGQTWTILRSRKCIARDGKQTRRRLAPELRVELGLANAYLRHCLRKGLADAHKARARLHTCHPMFHGFSEKSRHTFEFTSRSLNRGAARDVDLTTPWSGLVSVNDVRCSCAPVRNITVKFRAERIPTPALLGVLPRHFWRAA